MQKDRQTDRQAGVPWQSPSGGPSRPCLSPTGFRPVRLQASLETSSLLPSLSRTLAVFTLQLKKKKSDSCLLHLMYIVSNQNEPNIPIWTSCAKLKCDMTTTKSYISREKSVKTERLNNDKVKELITQQRKCLNSVQR